jgi:hypothetical protein
MLGLCLGGLAAWKGYSGLSDPVPEYTEVDRAFRDAANAALAHQDAVRNVITDTCDREDAALTERLEGDGQIVSRARELAGQAAYIGDQYVATRDNLVNIANTVVMALIEASQEVRPDLPDYLGPNAFYGPGDFPTPAASLAWFEDRVRKLEALQAFNLATVPALRRRLLDVRRRAMAKAEEAIAKVAEHDHDAATRAARTTLMGGL